MPSPFPGMDPYLEPHWLDVHTKLVTYLADAIEDVLPSDLVVRTEERFAIESSHETTRVGPDARVFERDAGPGRRPLAAGTAGREIEPDVGAMMLAPIRLVMPDDPITERFIRVLDADGERLITTVELLSPTNKRPPGRVPYLRKRSRLLRAGVSVVEVDLVRAGDWRRLLTPHVAPPRAISTYRFTTRTPGDRDAVHLTPIDLRDAIPDLRVPLRPGERPVVVSLQPLLARVYLKGRYAETLDYAAGLDPPLPPDDAAWADALLRAAGRRA